MFSFRRLLAALAISCACLKTRKLLRASGFLSALNFMGCSPKCHHWAQFRRIPGSYTAGILSAKDTIYLVGARAKLLTILCTASTGVNAWFRSKLPFTAIERTISTSSSDLACIYLPTNTLLSEPSQEIERIMEKFQAPRGSTTGSMSSNW